MLISQYVRIAIWILLIGIGFASGFVTGRFGFPSCMVGILGTTASNITDYSVEYDTDGKTVKKKTKRVMVNPKISESKEKKVAPDWGFLLEVEPIKRQQFGLGVEYKVLSDVFGTDANFYITGKANYDREHDKITPFIGGSLKF